MNRHNFLLVVAVCLMASVGLVSALNTYISNGYSVFNGSVGIGTNNPNYRFHVNGSSVKIESPDNSRVDFYLDALNGSSSGAILSGTSSGDLALQWVGGHLVGIGTTEPSGMLDIVDSRADNVPLKLGSSSTTEDETWMLFTGMDNNSVKQNFGGISLRYINHQAGSIEGRIMFYVTDGLGSVGSPKMSITQIGRVGIGTDNPGRKLDVRDTLNPYVIKVIDSSNTCDFGVDGSGWVSSCSSDNRLKTDIKDTGDVLNWLMNFRIRDYIWKSNGERGTGVIAQEVQKFAPEMVQIGEDGYLRVSGVNEWKLVKAIQELAMENRKLHDEVGLLKQELCKKDPSYNWCHQKNNLLFNPNLFSGIFGFIGLFNQ